jgi:hypothetical protein
MEEEKEQNQALIVQPGVQNGERDEQSMFVAIISHDGVFQDVTPISPEALTSVQKTLQELAAVEPKAKKQKRVAPLPAVTSQHVTPMPGTDMFLAITGSFGANVKKPSSWQAGQGFDLVTPTGGRLRVQGDTGGENTALQNYVIRELGTEGLKELAVLIDAYDLLTQGQEQTLNVEVTAKQVLQRMGKGEHSDDTEAQNHLVNTARYLSAMMAIGITATEERMSPLLVLENVTRDSTGVIRLKYHLGEETFEAIYGSQPNLYPLPTPRVIGYHGIRSQFELNLTFNLGNRIAQGGCSLYFTTICLHGGLSLERLLPGQKNRMRDAQQIITALLQLERDEFLVCEGHPDLDMVIAIDLRQEKIKAGNLTSQRLERAHQTLLSLKGYKDAELNAKRRAALQRLLNIDASREDRHRENPEFCTRMKIAPGTKFLTKQKELLAGKE